MEFLRYGLLSKKIWQCSLGAANVNRGETGQTDNIGRGDIPNQLSFDNIVAGRTSAPLTTRDFMNYLQYVQFSAENLQFYLWLVDYEKRWKTLSQDKQDLSPAWDPATCPVDKLSSCPKPPLKIPVADTAWNSTFSGDFGNKSKEVLQSPSKAFFPPPLDDKMDNPFQTPGSSQSSWKGNGSVVSLDTLRSPISSTLSDAYTQGKGETAQPFREEIFRVIALYVSPGSPRELNLTSKEREQLLHGLTHTTHPSVFTQVKSSVEWTLRYQSHPGFIQWSLCNGSPARVIFARVLGTTCLLGGLAVALWTILSSKNRGWRAFAALAWFLGITLLLSAWNGICPILQGFHHRHLRPWELWEDVGSEVGLNDWKSMDMTGKHEDSYEDRPWKSKYANRNVLRKVFEQEVWVEEPALRKVQDLLLFQSCASGFVLAAILCGILMAIPQ